MDKLDNFKGKRNSNGLARNPQNINKSGRPASLKAQLQKQLDGNGSVFIPTKRILETSKKGITIQTTTTEQLASKLVSWALSRNGNHSLKALQLIAGLLEGFDVEGLRKIEYNQTIVNNATNLLVLDYTALETDTLKAMSKTNENNKIDYLSMTRKQLIDILENIKEVSS